MASTLSSSSSLTPADSASSAGTFKTPAPVNPDVRRFKSKTYRRVYLERLKKPRTGWWWAYGCEWDEEPVLPGVASERGGGVGSRLAPASASSLFPGAASLRLFNLA
jgi:hypothetical protein